MSISPVGGMKSKVMEVGKKIKGEGKRKEKKRKKRKGKKKGGKRKKEEVRERKGKGEKRACGTLTTIP